MCEYVCLIIYVYELIRFVFYPSGGVQTAQFTILNRTYQLNSSDTKRLIVGIPLDHIFNPLIILENPRYPNSKVALSTVEWTQLCENSMRIMTLFSGNAPGAAVLDLEKHAVGISDYPGSIKIFNKGECVHLQEKTFTNLLYSSFAVQKSIDECVKWRAHVQFVYETLLRKLRELTSLDGDMSEEAIQHHYDSCCSLFYDPTMPDVFSECRAYLSLHFVPALAANK